jgi:predicted transcriptional regulator
MTDEITTFLESPWIKEIAKSRYMVELLRFLSIGRRPESIREHLKEVPEPYLMAALEALSSLGLLRELDTPNGKFYVLSQKGKIVLSYIEQFTGSNV